MRVHNHQQLTIPVFRRIPSSRLPVVATDDTLLKYEPDEKIKKTVPSNSPEITLGQVTTHRDIDDPYLALITKRPIFLFEIYCRF